MKLVSFCTPGNAEPRAGAALESAPNEVRVLDFAHAACDLPDGSDPMAFADLDGEPLSRARSLVADVTGDPARQTSLVSAGALLELSAVSLRAPIPRPGKVICIGLNYKDHAEESGMELPERPLCFSKFSSCAIGSGQEVVSPPGTEQLDFEAELGVVIGRRATRVPAATAMDHVLGYCNVNDVSARDFQFADGQWQRGKSCDTFCPAGPWLVTRDDVPDPQRLPIRFRLNGETLQNSNTDQLIFGIAELIEHLSAFVTLEPGDLISTGTPPGVGFARKPPVYVQAGDVMEVEIEGLGVLRNPVVAAG